MSDSNPPEDARPLMRDLRLTAGVERDPSSAHLSDYEIATTVDGAGESRPGAIAHLSECAQCRARLAAVTNLLEDSSIATEVNQLESETTTRAVRRWPPPYWGAIATLAAAAAVAIIVVGPKTLSRTSESSPVFPEAHREGTVTTTAPPRILSPATIGSHDSLRWTSVAGADMYRVEVWDREGNVVMTRETRDTSLVPPPAATGKSASYLWEVKARTGWDRWVSSDFVELTVRPEAR